MSHILNEDFSTRIEADTSNEMEATPSDSNIISLAEQGLLSPDASSRREDASYHDYSPLNEW